MDFWADSLRSRRSAADGRYRCFRREDSGREQDLGQIMADVADPVLIANDAVSLVSESPRWLESEVYHLLDGFGSGKAWRSVGDAVFYQTASGEFRRTVNAIDSQSRYRCLPGWRGTTPTATPPSASWAGTIQSQITSLIDGPAQSVELSRPHTHAPGFGREVANLLGWTPKRTRTQGDGTGDRSINRVHDSVQPRPVQFTEL